MKKLIIYVFTLLLCMNLFAQKEKKTLLFIQPSFSQTLADRTKGNNIYGIGLGLQWTIQTKTKFSPTMNVTDNFIFLDDKVYRTNSNGTQMKSIQNVFKLFIGTNYDLTKHLYLSFLAGPGFINEEILLGISPSLGFYISKTKRFTTNISYTNILNRNSGEKENYISLNFSTGLRIN